MSKNELTVSSEGHGEVERDSVFDFLYHDARRIASFLAQFDANGHLTGLSASDGVTKGAKRSKRIGFGAQSPVGGGNFEFELGPGEEGSHSLERLYDPYWANARAFLDYLAEHNLIQRDIEAARIGQFVLVTGSLIISDLKMLQSLWNLPSVKASMIKSVEEQQTEAPSDAEGQNRHERRKNQAQRRAAQKAEIPDELAITMEMLPHMPHGGQMHILANDKPVWAPISDGCLVSPISELILKHGPKIAGNWSAVGILDALPWEEGAEMSVLEMVQVGMLTGANISTVALNLASPIRQVMGRPILSYGITPLLVFREVA